MLSSTDSNLTIGAVAAATHVSVAVLRAWETHDGFPAPDRMPSGHRRYSARHVEQIQQIQRHRDAGMSLDAAISRTVASDQRAESSIFAGLRRRWPDLPVHVLSKRALMAISRSIEDETCARAERPVLVGSFQREHFYRQSEDRWRELSRTAASAIVFADFPGGRLRHGVPTEVSVAYDAPLLREWAVVCDASNLSACVVALERAGRGDQGARRFEALWSVDPGVVRDAADMAAALAGHTTEAGLRPPTDPVAMLASATAVVNRIVAYLDNGAPRTMT